MRKSQLKLAAIALNDFYDELRESGGFLPETTREFLVKTSPVIVEKAINEGYRQQ